jgi:hypothetical protein
MVDASISGAGEDDMSRNRPGIGRVVVFFGSREESRFAECQTRSVEQIPREESRIDMLGVADGLPERR